MNIRSILLAAALLIAVPSLIFAQAAQGQASQDEQNLAKAVMTAPDPVVQIKTAADFVKKYPKSTLRPRLAQELAQKIDGATDPAQKVSGAQAYREIFTEPAEQEMIMPVLVEGLIQTKRTDARATKSGKISTNTQRLAKISRKTTNVRAFGANNTETH